MLTRKRGFGGFVLYALIAIPVLTFVIEFSLTAILQPVIQNIRFEYSNRLVGISIIAAIAITVFVSGRLNVLIICEEEQTSD
jgi:hypothetical protein